MMLHKIPDGRVQPPRHATLIMLFGLIAMIASACGAPQAASTGPTPIPAATRLGQIFPRHRTASTPTAELEQATVMPTSTSVLPAAAVLAPDPHVRPGCKQPSASASKVTLEDRLSFDVTLDATPTGRTISPLIYGLGSAPDKVDWYRDMGIRLVRWGGNHTTRENWEINASNAGADWNFANVSHGWPDAAAGTTGDDLVRFSQSIDAAAILTIPTVGWVAKDGDNSTRSSFVAEYGGPPLKQGGEAIASYDPDANRRSTSVKSVATKGRPFEYPPDTTDKVVYQDEWVAHLVKTFGRAGAGGLGFYALDNEPDLWSVTHRDVHPVQMGYDDMITMWEEYADAIKAVDPSAQILAPVLSGATALVFSELDRGGDNFRTAADRAKHRGMPFLRWFLQEARIRDKQAGQRRLDYVDVHFYPQNGVYPEGNDADTNALRLRSTQELWNPDYTSESWIQRTEVAKLALIPRLHDWVATHYPGTKIAITEWSFGADNTTNGALTIADVLGIFGREGVDMATYWYYPAPGGPGASAFKLYGNYDGCGRHFGDEVLQATSDDEQSLAAYAARDSHSGDITLVLINKLPDKAIDARLNFSNLGARTVQVYQFNDDHADIRRLPDLQTDSSRLIYSIPQYSTTLLVFKQ